MTVTSVQCQFEMPDGESCGGEIEIEWEQHHLPPKTTGYKVCRVCGENDGPLSSKSCTDLEGIEGSHEWVDEYDDGDYQEELVSYRTYCWHPLTKEQARELLDDLAIAAAECRADG